MPPQFRKGVAMSNRDLTDCSCHSSPQFLAPASSHSVYLASGSQAYSLVLVVLDSQMDPALQLPPLLFPAALAPREVYPCFPQLLVAVGFFAFLLRETVL